MELHAILIADVSHDLDLLDQALLPLVLAVGRLLGEGLHCVASVVLDLFGQVDRGEVALPDFLLGFELLVEASLVESGSEYLSPLLKVC